MVFLLVGLMGVLPLSAQRQEFTKTIKKEFDLSPEGLTNISNRYGKVIVKSWDKNRTKIDVKITVRASSEDNAKKVFDRIRIDFTNTSDMVSAQTTIDAEKGTGWNWTFTSNSKNDYTIDYDVTIPAAGRLDLSNKYGDAFLSSIGGKSRLDIKYGNVQLEEIKEHLSLLLGYGNGTVVKAKDITVSGSYCQLRVSEAKDVDVTSKYSKISITRAGDVKSNSQYDSYKVEEVRDFKNTGKYDNLGITFAENLSVQSKYAEVAVQKVSNSVDLDLHYGSATIDKVAKGFSEVRLLGNYADFKVKVEEGANYQVEAVADYAGIRYPAALQVTYEKDKGTYHEVNGYIGQKGARSVIKAKLDYGGLKVW